MPKFQTEYFCPTCGILLDRQIGFDLEPNGFATALLMSDAVADHRAETGCPCAGAWISGPTIQIEEPGSQPKSVNGIVVSSLAVLAIAMGLVGALIPRTSQAQICPPGKTPAPLVFLCVNPAPSPTPAQIRTEIREFVPFVPVTLRPHLNNVLTWDDHDLGTAYEVGLATARRFSGGMPGPVDPEAVPDYQVKYWIVEVLKREGGLFKVLIPIVRAVPDEVLKQGYVRAVRLKRGQTGG